MPATAIRPANTPKSKRIGCTMVSSSVSAPPLPGTRLWTRNFGLFFTARIVSMLGDTMMPVAMAVAMISLGYGVSGIGYALGAWMGSFALFVVFGGVFADRFHPCRR